MPTILEIFGWRPFFYSNEGNEPVHVDARKGEAECKYWVLIDEFDIEESYAHGMTPKDRREIRKIIFIHFEYIIDQWEEFQKRKQP